MREKKSPRLGRRLVLPVLIAVLGLSIGSAGAPLFPASAPKGADGSLNSASGLPGCAIESTFPNGCDFSPKKINSAVKIGDSKEITFTLAPSDVSDKNIIVLSSDASKVTVSPQKIRSGEKVTIRLASATFPNTVYIKAKAEIDPDNIHTEVPVKITDYNPVTSIVYWGLGGYTSESIKSYYFVPTYYKGHRYYNGEIRVWVDRKEIGWLYNEKARDPHDDTWVSPKNGTYMSYLFRAYGRDRTRYPSLLANSSAYERGSDYSMLYRAYADTFQSYPGGRGGYYKTSITLDQCTYAYYISDGRYID